MKPEALWSIQVLRGLAALMVVQFHISRMTFLQDLTWYKACADIGPAGVDLFFVISGFVMWHSISKRPQTATQFMANRIIRIVPLYWIVTAMTAVALAVMSGAAGNKFLAPDQILSSLLFLPFDVDAEGQSFPIVYQGWTLNLEMFFYLLLAAGLLVGKRTALLCVAAGLPLTTLLGQLAPVGTAYSFYGNTIVFEFAFGIAIAWVYLSGCRIPMLASILLGIAAAGLVILPAGQNSLPRVIEWGLPAAALLCACVLAKTSVPGKGNWLAALAVKAGDASYSIYLWHALILLAIPKISLLVHFGFESFAEKLWFVSGANLACLIASLISYQIIELKLTSYLRSKLAVIGVGVIQNTALPAQAK